MSPIGKFMFSIFQAPDFPFRTLETRIKRKYKIEKKIKKTIMLRSSSSKISI